MQEKEPMRHIEVKHQNGRHMFVDDYFLEDLIRSGEIEKFYRPSEKRWVKIGVDPIRKEARFYRGPERRKPEGPKR